MMDISNLDESKIKQLSALIKTLYLESNTYMLFECEPTDMYLEGMLLAKIAMLDKNEAVDLVAIDQGMVVGECEIIRVAGGHSAKIGIFLDMNWRGKGVGKALLERALGGASHMGIGEVRAEVDASNERAIAFFLNRGFEGIGFEDIAGRRIRAFRLLL